MVILKSSNEIELMREPCHIVKEVLEKLSNFVEVGKKTKSIDKFVYDTIISRSAVPSFKNYRGFPGSACISINEVVVHGIPDETVLKEGDIVSIDVGAYKNGFHGDAARTYAVGEISSEAQNLIDITKESFFKGIEEAKVEKRLHDISSKIQSHIEDTGGYSVIRDYYGHGIGRSLHEEPTIPHFGKPNRGTRLRAGMVLAIEPMVAMGNYEVETLEDGWTVVTKDRSLAAHYENTVALTSNGPEILTL